MYSTKKRNTEKVDCPGGGFSHELKIDGIYHLIVLHRLKIEITDNWICKQKIHMAMNKPKNSTKTE
jgi:hypothetical protein